MKLPDEVAGATLVAFGSALPDMLATSIGIATNNSDLGLGGVVGSAVIAFALIPGLCGLAVRAPSPITLYSVLRDSLVFGAGIGMLIYFCSDGRIEMWEAGCLAGGYIVYLLIVLIPVCCRKAMAKRKHSVSIRTSIHSTKHAAAVDGHSNASTGLLEQGHAPSRDNDSADNLEEARRKAVTETSYGSTRARPGHGGSTTLPQTIYQRQLSRIQEEEDLDAMSPPSSVTDDCMHQPSDADDVDAFSSSDSMTETLSRPARGKASSASGNPNRSALPKREYAALADKFNTDPGPEWMTGGFRYERGNGGSRFQKPGLLGATPAVMGYNFNAVNDAENRARAATHNAAFSNESRNRNRSTPARSWGGLYRWARRRRASMARAAAQHGGARGVSANDLLDADEGALATTDESVPDGKLMRLFKMIWWPFYFIFRWTIPDLHRCPKLYFLTFVISLIYLGGISYAGFQITDDIAHNVFFDPVLAGETMIAIGTSVPDILSSVFLARLALVDAALSNAVGAQIISILLGVGLPSLVYGAVSGKDMELDVGRFSGGLLMLLICIVLYMIMTLGLSTLRFKKPVVDRVGGVVMLGCFLVVIGIVVADFYGHIFTFVF
eukprot:INCI6151.1.p1 GENE.INCI6151.1~~INCI6151.1.p1  ORF type:complete len:610 (-),score=68.24 INCI6151.1:429-2258(-)